MRYFILITIGLILTSCGSSLGKIDLREGSCFPELKKSKKVYLVNTSRNKTFRFTCKKTEIINDTGKVYSIEFYTLSPGDETYIGCSETLSKQSYETKEIVELFEEKKKSLQELIDEKKKGELSKLDKLIDSMKQEKSQKVMSDTFIIEKKKFHTYTVIDTTKKLKRNHSIYKYEITGEVETKEEVE